MRAAHAVATLTRSGLPSGPTATEPLGFGGPWRTTSGCVVTVPLAALSGTGGLLSKASRAIGSGVGRNLGTAIGAIGSGIGSITGTVCSVSCTCSAPVSPSRLGDSVNVGRTLASAMISSPCTTLDAATE